MVNLQIDDELSAALRRVADSQNVSVEALLRAMLQRYQIEKNNELPVEPIGKDGWHGEALDRFSGMFDDDVDDLSTSVHELVTNALKKKHANLG